jgi:hypothetical protein
MSEKYTACVFCRLSKDRHSMFFRTVSISDELVSVLKDTIAVVFELKLCHGCKGVGLWYGIVVLEVSYSTPHSIVIKICFSF